MEQTARQVQTFDRSRLVSNRALLTPGADRLKGVVRSDPARGAGSKCASTDVFGIIPRHSLDFRLIPLLTLQRTVSLLHIQVGTPLLRAV